MIRIERGFHESERALAAHLFWQAFSAKLGKVMGPEARALRFFEAAMDPAFALAARDDDGALLGLAGFKTAQGGLVAGELQDLAQVYGWFGALWRGMLLGALERDVKPDVFQMDGIFVDASARGRGVGTALLQAVLQEAAQRGLAEVQLDVIDSNPRARALYERVGFKVVGTETTGPLKWIFCFSSATRMRCTVSTNATAGKD